MRRLGVGPRSALASGPSCARGSVRLKRTVQGCFHEQPIGDGGDPAAIRVMRPTQFLRRAEVRRGEPERRLMVAVLRTVMDDCWGSVYRRSAGYGVPTDLRGIRRAIAYVASTDRTWPFSFENVREAIGIDANGLRERLDVTRALE